MISNSRTRIILAGLTAVSLMGAVYASAIPLRYHPATLSDLWDGLIHIQWRNLGLGKRDDWVANGLILIPFGFFFAGAFHYPKSTFRRKQVVFISFALLHAVIVCAIEAMQIWFPPRVVSLNDLVAGYIGGLSGILLWNVTGNRVVDTLIQFPALPKGFPRVAQLVKIAALGLVLYGTMPFDVLLTPSEWAAKADANRFHWIPFADLSGPIDAATKFILSGWSFLLGVVLAAQHSQALARKRILLWCLAVEFASLPIYGRETSLTPLIFTILWGLAGVRWHREVLSGLQWLDTRWNWFAAAIIWSITVYVSFIIRYKRVVTDREILIERLNGIFAVPFARAQRSSEFQALENISLKLAVFALVGFLLAGWLSRSRVSDRWAVYGVTGLWAFLVAVAIEVSQAFLSPLVADITDVILYVTGGMLGVFVYRMLMPPS